MHSHPLINYETIYVIVFVVNTFLSWILNWRPLPHSITPILFVGMKMGPFSSTIQYTTHTNQEPLPHSFLKTLTISEALPIALHSAHTLAYIIYRWPKHLSELCLRTPPLFSPKQIIKGRLMGHNFCFKCQFWLQTGFLYACNFRTCLFIRAFHCGKLARYVYNSFV